MQMIAQGLLVLELWDSAFALGAVNFANALPSLLVMVFGGVLADRADKRRILLWTQLVMCLLALGVGVLVLSDLIEFWMIILATIALGIAFGYDMPAYQAFLPELVPPQRISQVVGLNSATFHGSRMIGPAIGGAVIGLFGIATAYFINAASFVAVIFSLLIVRYRPKQGAAQAMGSTLDGLKQGFRYARSRPTVLVLLALTALACLFLFPFMAILSAYYVTDVLDEGAGVLGLMWAASGVGSLLGAMALVWWPSQLRTERIVAGAIVGPIALVVMAITREPAVAIIAAGFASIAFSSQLNMFGAMLQESTPQEFRGRVMSLNGIAFNGTMPLSGMGAAALAVVFGLPSVMIGAAVLYAVLAAVTLWLAAGGIANVVRMSHAEYAALSAEA
jgi:MFS family permease